MELFWIIAALVIIIIVGIFLAIINREKRLWLLRKEYWEDWEEGLLQRIENWEEDDQIDAQLWHDVQFYNRELKRAQAAPKTYFLYSDPALDFAPIKVKKIKKGE